MARVRTLFAFAVVAASTTACTAIILGTLDDEKGVPDAGAKSAAGTSSGTSGTSGTSGGPKENPCSLRAANTFGTELTPDNTCADCIETECADDVAYACDGGDGRRHKGWFATLQGCAQNPWIDYPDPDSGVSLGIGWGCSSYNKADQSPIDSKTDEAAQRASEICVKQKCVFDGGKAAPCRKCEVSFTTSAGDVLLLKDDPCGKCFTEECGQTILDCCDSAAIDDFVRFCADTPVKENLENCAKIAEASDLGTFDPPHEYGYNDAGKVCAKRLADCWNDKCLSNSKCTR